MTAGDAKSWRGPAGPALMSVGLAVSVIVGGAAPVSAVVAPEVRATAVTVVARGAALVVDLSVRCPNSPDFLASLDVQVAQQVAAGVQHESVRDLQPPCDGTLHAVRTVVFPPEPLNPPPTPGAVSRASWTTQPVLVAVAVATPEGSASSSEVLAAQPAVPTVAPAPFIHRRAELLARGAGLLARVRATCQPSAFADLGIPDTVLLTVAQVGPSGLVQTVRAEQRAQCDGRAHEYAVALPAQFQAWVRQSAVAQVRVCPAFSGFCYAAPRTAFRTIWGVA